MPRRVAIVLASCVLVAAMAGCVKNVTIGQILADPGRYYGKTVKVEGRVSDGYQAAGINIYKIEADDAGLWVLSYKSEAPANGLTIVVKGRVNKATVLAGVPLPTHLVEDSREAAK